MATKKTTKAAAKKVAKKTMSKKATPTKTTTKKSAATKKETAAKKTTKKTSSKKLPLTVASPEQAFWMVSGDILHTLVDLESALQTMDAVIYAHHVSDARNDFADWVEHVLTDGTCARNLRHCPSPTKACDVVAKRLKVYIV